MRLLGVLLILGCSSSSTAPNSTKRAQPKPVITFVCDDTIVGGWDGTPECAQAANTPIPGADRRCSTNTDCIRIGPHCSPLAIRADRTDAYQVTACSDPASGECPPPCAAVCRAGCCEIPAGWGDNCR